MKRISVLIFIAISFPIFAFQSRVFPHVPPEGALFDFEIIVTNPTANELVFFFQGISQSPLFSIAPKSVMRLDRETLALDNPSYIDASLLDQTLRVELKYTAPGLESPLFVLPKANSGYLHRYRTPTLREHWFGVGMNNVYSPFPVGVYQIEIVQTDADGHPIFNKTISLNSFESKTTLLLSGMGLIDDPTSFIEIHTNFPTYIQALHGSLPGTGALQLNEVKPIDVSGMEILIDFAGSNLNPGTGRMKITELSIELKSKTTRRDFSVYGDFEYQLIPWERQGELNSILQEYDVYNMVLNQEPDHACDTSVYRWFTFIRGAQVNRVLANPCDTVDFERADNLLTTLLTFAASLRQTND